MFAFFNECTRIINSPSCYVLNFESHYFRLKVPWRIYGIFKVSFINSFQLFLIIIFFLSMCICFLEFDWIKTSGIFQASQVQNHRVASRPIQPSILLRSNKWWLRISGDLVVKSKLSPYSGSIALRQLSPIHQKGP